MSLVENKETKFSFICCIITKLLQNNTWKDTEIKFDLTVDVAALMYRSEPSIMKEKDKSKLHDVKIRLFE